MGGANAGRRYHVGGSLAMPGYGVGILPLLATIKPEELNDQLKMKHVAYADDPSEEIFDFSHQHESGEASC